MCQGDSVTLQCNASSVINVIKALYGVYVVTCDTDCCEPDQFDCPEDMEHNNATEWERLKACTRTFVSKREQRSFYCAKLFQLPLHCVWTNLFVNKYKLPIVFVIRSVLCFQ